MSNNIRRKSPKDTLSENSDNLLRNLEESKRYKKYRIKCQKKTLVTILVLSLLSVLLVVIAYMYMLCDKWKLDSSVKHFILGFMVVAVVLSIIVLYIYTKYYLLV